MDQGTKKLVREISLLLGVTESEAISMALKQYASKLKKEDRKSSSKDKESA